MSSKTLDWKCILNHMSKQCQICVMVWKRQTSTIPCNLFLVNSDWLGLKKKNSIGVYCLVELGVHIDLSMIPQPLVREYISGMHHETQAESLFWLFIHRESIIYCKTALLKCNDFIRFSSIKTRLCTSSNTLPKYLSLCFLQVQI